MSVPPPPAQGSLASCLAGGWSGYSEDDPFIRAGSSLCPQGIFANIKTEAKEDSECSFANVSGKLEQEHSFISHAEADEADFST